MMAVLITCIQISYFENLTILLESFFPSYLVCEHLEENKYSMEPFCKKHAKKYLIDF